MQSLETIFYIFDNILVEATFRSANSCKVENIAIKEKLKEAVGFGGKIARHSKTSQKVKRKDFEAMVRVWSTPNTKSNMSISI